MTDQPFAAVDLRSEAHGAKPAPSPSPVLESALTSIEPGTPRWLDEIFASDQSSFALDEVFEHRDQRPQLSQKSVLMLSRLLFAQPPGAPPGEAGREIQPGEAGRENQPAEWGGAVAPSAGPAGWQWSGGGLGGGPSYSFSVGADAGDARAGAPADTHPVFSKVLPVLTYLRENREWILGVIAAVLLFGGYLGSRANRR